MMGVDGSETATERFYRRLLDLTAQNEIEPLLDEALALITSITGAGLAYLELRDPETSRLRFSKGHRCTMSDVEVLRTWISNGLIESVVNLAGELVAKDFKATRSARQKQIEGILAVPLGHPPIGAIYLLGRTDARPFTELHCEYVELLARQLGPLAERLIPRSEALHMDYTCEIRGRFACSEIVGSSSALTKALQNAANVAPLNIDVLIVGPSGSGRSALARAIARNDPQRQGPFVEFNGAAASTAEIETEFVGSLISAAGGTLFVDQVSALPPTIQAKLCQVLRRREYKFQGTKPDIRLVVGTTCELGPLVSANQFREDLYYSLQVVTLNVPGLDARRDDIPALVEHFCVEASRRHGWMPISVSRSAISACREARWPGNVRQLANSVEGAVIAAHGETATTLLAHHVFPDAPFASTLTLAQATRRFQKRHLFEALETNDWRVNEAAAELGIARSSLYSMIKDLEIRRRSPR